MKKDFFKKIARVSVGVFGLLPLFTYAAEITTVQLERFPPHERVVFTVVNPKEYNILTLENPYRVIVDFNAAHLYADVTHFNLKGSGITYIQASYPKRHMLRIVFNMSKPVDVKDYVTLGNRPHEEKLVVDMLSTNASSATFGTPTAVPKDSPAPSTKTWSPVISIGVGDAITSGLGESQNFPAIDPTTDEFYNYSPSGATQTAGFVDGFLGVEWRFRPTWALQAGVDYNQAALLTASGTLTQGADVLSQDTYRYNYSILTRQLLAEGKLLYTFKERYHPYVMAGVGASFNKAYNYSTNIPLGIAFTRIYQNNTTSSFSYAVGLGFDVDIFPHIRLGIGYRFANLGQVQLGNAAIDTTPVSGTLSQTHLYTNEVLAQLTWVLN